MFYVHTLSLPLFAVMGNDLLAHAALWTASPAVVDAVPTNLSTLLSSGMALIGSVPVMWAVVAVNVISQYVIRILTPHPGPRHRVSAAIISVCSGLNGCWAWVCGRLDGMVPAPAVVSVCVSP